MKRLVVFGIVACCFARVISADVLITNDSEWRYLHPTDGKDPAETVKDFHSTFMKADFDDSGWKKGKDKPGEHGGFGYGDSNFEGVDLGQPEDAPEAQNGEDIAAESKRKSAYFRLRFISKDEHTALLFKCQRDDGIIVYIDGEEVLRDNVKKDEKDRYDLFAENTTSGSAETKVNKYAIKKKLAPGEHVMAISLHNRSGGSSDLRIAEISLESVDEKELDNVVKDTEGEEAGVDDLF
ncbi:MAG: hypothetical protein KDB27_26340 [Planctomycetales bacterium]|nr:hypothetical protein [Planctomycetales bacterium]